MHVTEMCVRSVTRSVTFRITSSYKLRLTVKAHLQPYLLHSVGN